MGGVGGEKVGGLDQGLVLCLCESRFFVKMAGQGICILCWVDTCAS